MAALLRTATGVEALIYTASFTAAVYSHIIQAQGRGLMQWLPLWLQRATGIIANERVHALTAVLLPLGFSFVCLLAGKRLQFQHTRRDHDNGLIPGYVLPALLALALGPPWMQLCSATAAFAQVCAIAFAASRHVHGNTIVAGTSLLFGTVLVEACLYALNRAFYIDALAYAWSALSTLLTVMVTQTLQDCCTVGESMLVAQGLTACIVPFLRFDPFRSIMLNIGVAPPPSQLPSNVYVATAQASIVATLILLALCVPSLFLLRQRQKGAIRTSPIALTVVFGLNIAFATAWCVWPFLSAVVGQPFGTFLFDLMTEPQHFPLVAIWAALLVAITLQGAVASVTPSYRPAWRKLFHFLIVMIVVPGMVLGPRLLSVAAAGAMVVLIMAEVTRVFNIAPFHLLAWQLHNTFADERDLGAVALTPIYLLLGIAMPMWLSAASWRAFSVSSTLSMPNWMASMGLQWHVVQYVVPLEWFAGILSIGIGDAAAAIVGSRIGRNHVFGTRKTWEGMTASILAQAASIWLTNVTLGTNFSTARALPAVLANAVLECTTQQIDNLFIPLFTLVVLRYSV